MTGMGRYPRTRNTFSPRIAGGRGRPPRLQLRGRGPHRRRGDVLKYYLCDAVTDRREEGLTVRDLSKS